MISERHTSIAIFNWLAKWMSSDVPNPKETVCDQSIALLSAISRCFTQYSSLKDYIQICADIVFKKLPSDSYWLPKCFIRVDVAHFIKLVSKWAPLKTSSRQVREIILRVIGVVLKSQSVTFIREILLSLFIVVINETDGKYIATEDLTPCEQHKRIIIQAVTTDFVEIEDILGFTEMERDGPVDEEYEYQYNEFEYNDSPFQQWAEDIHKQSECYIREGRGLNAMYLPSVVTCIKKCIKLLPLWSSIMVPFFGYGETTTSSAAVESSFKKLKNVTFKHMTLPVDIEEFLEHHISSLQGASLIRSTIYNNQSLAVSPISDIIENNQIEDLESEEAITVTSKNLSLLIDSCPLCEVGNLPVENGAHKCVICDTPVHALPSCPTHELGK